MVLDSEGRVRLGEAFSRPLHLLMVSPIRSFRHLPLFALLTHRILPSLVLTIRILQMSYLPDHLLGCSPPLPSLSQRKYPNRQ